MKNVTALLMVTLLGIRFAFGAVDDGSVLHSGEATFYGDGGGGNCGFPGSEQPLYHGAMNHFDYDSAAACGTWVHIFGPRGEVTAFIDDRCPECQKGDIDLGPGTFEKIADKALGRVPITWRYVDAPVTGPIEYYWRGGSSQWYIAVQIRNHRYGITSVEIKTGSSEWIRFNRSFDNYFILPRGVNNAEPGPYDLRVTDILGRQLIDTGLTILGDQTVAGTANFDPIGPNAAIPFDPAHRSSLQPRQFIAINGITRALPTTAGGLFDIFTLSGRVIAVKQTVDQVQQLMRKSSRTGMVIVHVSL
jgi:expansin (peptidoglycan-binding protein)